MSPFVTLLQMINTQSAKKHNINAFVVNTTCFLTDVFLGLMVHYSTVLECCKINVHKLAHSKFISSNI